MQYPEHLQLGEFVDATIPAQSTDTEYTLYAVVVHDGVATFGHYWIFMRHGEKWLKYNDSSVTEIKTEDVFSNLGAHTNACALIYIQTSKLESLVEPFARTREMRSQIAQHSVEN
jgi:ubiquitin C-terminal hydrolase